MAGGIAGGVYKARTQPLPDSHTSEGSQGWLWSEAQAVAGCIDLCPRACSGTGHQARTPGVGHGCHRQHPLLNAQKGMEGPQLFINACVLGAT